MAVSVRSYSFIDVTSVFLISSCRLGRYFFSLSISLCQNDVLKSQIESNQCCSANMVFFKSVNSKKHSNSKQTNANQKSNTKAATI